MPYKNDLAARINQAEFRNRVGVGIGQKLNLIRRLGNQAVHDTQPIPAEGGRRRPAGAAPRRGVDGLPLLHRPAAVPTGAVFDPSVAGKNAPLSRADVVKLAEKFQAQDEAHAKALAERDDLAAAKDAEIEKLRAQIKAAQAANTLPDTRDYSEAKTRELIIDELLREAGWLLTDDRDREFEVTGMPNEQEHRLRRLRALGSRRSAAGGGGGEAHHRGAGRRPAAGQAVRRLPRADDRSTPGDLLHQRLPDLALGRRRRLPAPQGRGLLHRRRARAHGADAAPVGSRWPTARSPRRSSGGTTSSAPSAPSATPSPPSSATPCS